MPGETNNWSQFSFHEQLDKPLDQSWASYLQSRAFVRGPLAGSFPFEAQLNEKLQQVDEQLVYHLFSLKIGRNITQSIDHSQGAVSITQKQGRLKECRTHFYTFRYVGGSPVSVVLVVFGRIDHGASLDANLLEQVPHFLVDVLLNGREFGFRH